MQTNSNWFSADSQFLPKLPAAGIPTRGPARPLVSLLEAAIRPIAQSCCGEGRVLEVRLVPGQQVRTTGHSVCHCFCFPRDAALPQPRARARQTMSDRLFHREHACPGMDTPAGQNNNRNTPYLQALRLARPEATLNNLVSHCKRFGQNTKKPLFWRRGRAARRQSVHRLEQLGGEQHFR